MTDVRKVDSLAWIPTDAIRPNPHNPRQQLSDIHDLAASIKAQGLIQPLVVSPQPSTGGYRLIAGHRRLAALVHLGQPRALCVIRAGKPAADMVSMMLVENGQRVPLTPMEEARAMQRLLESGMSQKDIARHIGRNQGFVSMRLALVHLTHEDQAAVEAGHLSIGEGTALGRQRRNAPKGKGDRPGMRGWHFGHDHPLAAAAAALCGGSDHSSHRRIGAGACGTCWEQVIRDDERAINTRKEAS